jgi:hypothetical protein
MKAVALGLVLVSIVFLAWGQVVEKRAAERNPAGGA